MTEPITMDKKYRYRNGEPAEIESVGVNGSDLYPVTAINQQGCRTTHTEVGKYYNNNTEANSLDLIEVRPQPHIPPIGLVPKERWMLNRVEDIMRAIIKRLDGNEKVNPEWYEELHRTLDEIPQVQIEDLTNK